MICIHKIIYHVFILCLVIFSNVTFADINYYLTHIDDKIHVRAEFGNYNKQDKIKLIVPTSIFGTDYGRQIKNIKILDGTYNPTNNSANLSNNIESSDLGTEVAQVLQSSNRVVSDLRSFDYAKLIIEYDVVALPINNFINSFANKTYHYIDKNKFFILGEGFFIRPYKEMFNQQVIVHISSPVKKIAYNFKPYFNKGPITINFNDLSELIILGNEDLYINEPTNNTKLIVWSVDKNLGKRINYVTSHSLKQSKYFVRDINCKHIAIFIPNPFTNKVNAMTSRVINRTIVSFINPNLSKDSDLHKLVNHENIYFWLNCRLIKGPTWFTEGFSDYYMDKINYHFSGDKQQFINNYNDKLKKYFLSPVTKLINIYSKDNKFRSNALEKLLPLKGYIIAGQLDSIINLDHALRGIITNCHKYHQNCNFSKEFLFKYITDINNYQKDHINKLIDNLNLDYLSDSFLNIASLKTIRAQRFKYDDIIMNSVINGILPGNYLNNFRPNYQPNILYTLDEVSVTDNNKLLLLIKKDNKIEKFFPDVTTISSMIPYYK